MTQTFEKHDKPTLTELMFHPDRDVLEEEISMVLERAKQRGVERSIMADALYHFLRLHMTPAEGMTDVGALEWINQLRRYHSEIGNTLGLLEVIVGE